MSLALETYSIDFIESKLRQSTRLPSLKSINLALQDLLSSENSDVAEIGDVIQRDPSMTARILRLVNSVSFGINYRVQTVQEAVIFLGVRHVRQVALLTPVIDEFQNLPLDSQFSWRNFWKHCIGVGLISQEVLMDVDSDLADHGYIAGLIHDLGKIAMAFIFPEHFHQIYIQSRLDSPEKLLQLEKSIIGVSHDQLGGVYAELQNLEQPFVQAIRFHHFPALVEENPHITAAVQLADGIVHSLGLGASGLQWESGMSQCLCLPAWKILFPNLNKEQKEAHFHKLIQNAGHFHEIVDNLV